MIKHFSVSALVLCLIIGFTTPTVSYARWQDKSGDLPGDDGVGDSGALLVGVVIAVGIIWYLKKRTNTGSTLEITNFRKQSNYLNKLCKQITLMISVN